MPQTNNFGLPLWGDTPPEGATGKTLRDAIIGESPSSLANMVDAQLQELADEKESVSNKVETYTGWGGSWNESTEDYPYTRAVYEFVYDYISQYMFSHNYITDKDFLLYYKLLIKPVTVPSIDIDTFHWSGNTNGLPNFLGMFYKVSDSTEFPDTFKISLTYFNRDTGETEVDPTSDELPLNDTIADLKDTFGIVVYGMRIDSYFEPMVVVADRAGTLPAAVIEQMMGSNPGIDVPYEAGTYVHYQDYGFSVTFVSKATQCINVKTYIDQANTITETIVSWDGNTDGLPNVLDKFYKVSDNTYVPNKIVYRYADRSPDGTVTLDEDYITTEGVMTDLADSYGVYVPLLNGSLDGIIIAKRSGILPAAVISAITNVDIPIDIPYEAGTYVLSLLWNEGEIQRYVTEAFYTISTKGYIDSKFEELKTLIQSTNEGGNA